MRTNTSFQASKLSDSGIPASVMNALLSVRKEGAVTGQTSLLHCECPVGLLLFDIVTKLDISAEEQRYLLGSVLFDEVTEFLQK